MLAAFFPVDAVNTVIRASHTRHRIDLLSYSCVYRVDTIMTKDELLNSLKKESNQPYHLRYVLLEDNTVLLAPDGGISDTVPPHYLMTGKHNPDEATCLCAGKLRLDQDSKITYVDNQSVDFLPPDYSLELILIVLIALAGVRLVTLQDQLQIHFQNQKKTCIVPLNILREHISRIYTKEGCEDYEDVDFDTLTIPNLAATLPLKIEYTPLVKMPSSIATTSQHGTFKRKHESPTDQEVPPFKKRK